MPQRCYRLFRSPQKAGRKTLSGGRNPALTDDAATKDATLDGLEWIQKQTGSRDVAMIFLSGHGVQDGSGDYYYVPYNFDMARKRSTGVLFYEIEKTIKDIAGKVVFFVDTCHSGGAGGKTRAIGSDIVSIVNELSSADNGAIVFAASTGKEFALRRPEMGAWRVHESPARRTRGKSRPQRGRANHDHESGLFPLRTP